MIFHGRLNARLQTARQSRVGDREHAILPGVEGRPQGRATVGQEAGV